MGSIVCLAWRSVVVRPGVTSNQDEEEGRWWSGRRRCRCVRSYRDAQGKVRHENLGNLSHLPPEIIDAIRAMLAGRRLVDLDEEFEITRSLPHGHVAAVLGVLRDLDLERLLGRERCRMSVVVVRDEIDLNG